MNIKRAMVFFFLGAAIILCIAAMPTSVNTNQFESGGKLNIKDGSFQTNTLNVGTNRIGNFTPLMVFTNASASVGDKNFGMSYGSSDTFRFLDMSDNLSSQTEVVGISALLVSMRKPNEYFALAEPSVSGANNFKIHSSTIGIPRISTNGSPFFNLLGSGGGTPGGADTHVQWNSNGVFAGNSGLTYVNSTGMLTSTNVTVRTILTVGGDGATLSSSSVFGGPALRISGAGLYTDGIWLTDAFVLQYVSGNIVQLIDNDDASLLQLRLGSIEVTNSLILGLSTNYGFSRFSSGVIIAGGLNVTGEQTNNNGITITGGINVTGSMTNNGFVTNKLGMMSAGGFTNSGTTLFYGPITMSGSGANIIIGAGNNILNAASGTYTFSTDENTYMWRPAADALAFTTGGTDRFTINNTIITNRLPTRIEGALTVTNGTFRVHDSTFVGNAHNGFTCTNVVLDFGSIAAGANAELTTPLLGVGTNGNWAITVTMDISTLTNITANMIPLGICIATNTVTVRMNNGNLVTAIDLPANSKFSILATKTGTD